MEESERRLGKKKWAVIMMLIAAMALQILVMFLMPSAQHAGERFIMEPFYFLRYALRPFAMMFLGLAVVEAVKELAGIDPWKGKQEKTRKTARVVFYIMTAFLAVWAVFTLWMSVDMAHTCYLTDKALKARQDFDFSMIAHWMPEQLLQGILYFDMFYLDRIGSAGGYLLFGATLSFCRIEKE